MTIHTLVCETADIRRAILQLNTMFEKSEISLIYYASRHNELLTRYRDNVSLLAENRRDIHGRKF